MVDAIKLLTQPFAWSALKRALLRREILIESVAEMFSLVSTIQLEPQPIPLDVKVVLVGDRAVCQLLQALDTEFGKLFRVVADLDDDLPREPATQRALAATLAAQARAAGCCRPAGRAGAACRPQRAAQRRRDAAGRRRAPPAGSAARGRPPGAPPPRWRPGASSAHRYRRRRGGGGHRCKAGPRQRADERLRAATLRDIVSIATQGAQVGQVNGLAAYGMGDEWFGLPTRITATTRLGEARSSTSSARPRWAGPCTPRAC